jgi:GNAT superfamily N-acetyltransferase
MSKIEIVEADLTREKHCKAVIAMMDEFALDPMGSGSPLPQAVREALIPGLRQHPTTIVFLAFRGDETVGIAVCFKGFSTFAAKPLINLHDLFVRDELRGSGVGRALLEAVSEKVRAIGGCKVTLEVQSKNHHARGVYAAAGFEQAVYQEEAGAVLFLSKPL